MADWFAYDDFHVHSYHLVFNDLVREQIMNYLNRIDGMNPPHAQAPTEDRVAVESLLLDMEIPWQH